jgi:hypothetical protein
VKITKLKRILNPKFMLLALACSLGFVGYAADDNKEKDQKGIRKMAVDTLQTLYKAEPKTKKVVHSAAGYAVFSNLGVKILLAGSGSGKGIAVNNKIKKRLL